MTQIIDQLPLPVPSRTDPTNFSVRADNFLGELPDFATQVNALATELTALGNTVETNKNTAVTAANNAQASAFAATGSANNAASSSGAALWVSGTTYSAGNLVYSPITGRTYRRKIAGAGTTDPSADATNWIPIVLEISTQYPTIRPSLNLDFVNNKYLDPRITFTRSSTAKYFDGKTVHKAEENLLIRSEEFDNAAWVKDNTTVTVNTQVNPFGQSTAETLTETVTTAQQSIRQAIGSVSGVQYVLSIYVKYNTRQHIQLAFDSTGFNSTCFANFDIQNGTIGTVGAGATASIVSAGNGWYRCSIVCSAVATSTTTAPYILLANSSSMVYGGSYTGSTSNSVYIFGAQVEQRSSVGPYQATTTQPITNYQSTLVTASVNQPRFDHDPVTKECKGLLIEDATTNLIIDSENIDSGFWSKPNSSVASAGTVMTAPDGNLTARKLLDTNSSTTHYLVQTVSLTAGTTYSFSVYLKKAELSSAALEIDSTYAYFDLSTGTLGFIGPGLSSSDCTIQSVGNGWYRCSISVTALSTATGYARVYLAIGPASGQAAFIGNGYSGIYIWGAQLEANSASPSSYVATSGSTSSRSYDNAVMTGTNFSSWYNQEEGSVYSEFRIDQKPLTSYYNNRIWALNNPSGNSLYSYAEATTGKMYHDVVYNGSLTSQLQSSNPWDLNFLYRNSAGFKTNDVSVSYNSSIDTDMSNNIPKDITYLQLGAQSSGVAPLRGHLRRFTYYPKKLTNQELQTLTAI